MEPKTPCVLWHNTRELAKEKGFEMSRSCPIDPLCTGEVCIFISSPVARPNQLAKFYSRLQGWEERKLAELRQELKNINGTRI